MTTYVATYRVDVSGREEKTERYEFTADSEEERRERIRKQRERITANWQAVDTFCVVNVDTVYEKVR